MKKLRPTSSDRARKAACMVSAAALMLGVSQAATVGINFPVNYSCCVGNYINFVNAPAFGIPISGWQNVRPTGTGYGGPFAGATFTNLSTVIDTTPSLPADAFPDQPLNSIPNGALTISWGAPMANWSGFAGYNAGSAAQPAPTNGLGRGEAEVYAGFFRDGINFGPPGGPNNNQPGWFVDITGLKSLFTNSPYVIELVAAADSMYFLTNAFIIDATSSTTQSVSYLKPQHYGDSGDAPWFRAIGGGISTVTPTALNTDHVLVHPNRPQHSAGATHALSINNGATLSGIIITDKPVVTMSPQPVLAAAHDDVTLHTIAIGVPPLAYQWRNGGVPVPGATNANYNISNIVSGGSFDLVVANLYGGATSKVSVVTVDQIAANKAGFDFFLDSKPTGTKNDGHDFGATWLASSTDAAGTNRAGVAQFSSAATNQVTIPASTDFDGTNGTVMFWVRSAGIITNNGVDSAMLFDRREGSYPGGNSGLAVVQYDSGQIFVTTGPDTAISLASSKSISDNKWHHVAVSFDQGGANGEIKIYIDGAFDNSSTGASWPTPMGRPIELGHSHLPYWRDYNGLMDDVRYYNRILTAAEIASVTTSAALVDTTALKVRLNFDAAPVPGLTMAWQIADAVIQSATSVTGPYLDVLPAPASPYSVPVTSAANFYRYRHVKTTVNSNPYDM